LRGCLFNDRFYELLTLGLVTDWPINVEELLCCVIASLSNLEDDQDEERELLER
jgi:hypothetical protein